MMLQIVGLGLAIFSFFVLACTFPGKSGVIFLPGLVPVFNTLFGLIFLGLQGLFVYWLKSGRALFLLLTFSALGMLAGGFGQAVDIWGAYKENQLGLSRTVLCAGACAGGIALGLGLFKQWVQKQEEKKTGNEAPGQREVR